MRTYGFITTKFNESVKKRANPSEAEGHSGVLRIGSDENFDVTLEGLDDRKYHLLKIRIQEIRLLLEATHLRKGRTGTPSEPKLSETRIITHYRLHGMQSQPL